MSHEKKLLKASLTNNIRMLLEPHYHFRAAITYSNGKKIHLFGHEHSCTYNQVRAGIVTSIELNATKGYTDLIKYIEQKGKAGLIKSAKIYSRDHTNGPFLSMHRNWYNGDWEDINDPVIAPEKECRTFYPVIKNKRIEDITDIAPQQEENIDFKTEVNNALSKKK